jgi:hypothetical protein
MSPASPAKEAAPSARRQALLKLSPNRLDFDDSDEDSPAPTQKRRTKRGIPGTPNEEGKAAAKNTRLFSPPVSLAFVHPARSLRGTPMRPWTGRP